MKKAPTKRTSSTATLDALIAIANDAYGDDLVRAYADGAGDGDTLAKFLATELRDTFDPSNPHVVAAAAVGRAVAELARVRDALANAGERARASGRDEELVAPDGTRIAAVVETLYGNALVDSVHRNPDGTLHFEYVGETEIAWDTQEADRETTTGELLFLDEAGDEWRGSQLVPKRSSRTAAQRDR